MEKEKYVSVRIESLQKKKSIGQFSHDIRKKIPGYLKTTPKWKYIIKIEDDFNNILEDIEERYNSHNKRKIQKNARYTVSGIITFSEKVQNSDIENYDEYIKKLVERITQELDTSVIYIVKHLDEHKQHYHFQLSYIDNQGKGLRNKLTKNMMRKIQDIAGEVFKDVGIRRGKSKEKRIQEAQITGCNANIWHKSVAELHRTWSDDIFQKKFLELRKKYTKKELFMEMFDVDAYVNELEELYKNASKANVVLKEKIAELVQQIADIKLRNKKLSRIEWEIKRLKNNINNPHWLYSQIKKTLKNKKQSQLETNLKEIFDLKLL